MNDFERFGHHEKIQRCIKSTRLMCMLLWIFMEFFECSSCTLYNVQSCNSQILFYNSRADSKLLFLWEVKWSTKFAQKTIILTAFGNWRSKGCNFIEQMVLCSYMYKISVIPLIRIWYDVYHRAWSGYHTRVVRLLLGSLRKVRWQRR